MKKNLLKRLLSIGLIGVLSVSCFFGCGNSSASSSNASGDLTKDKDGLTEVTFVSPTALESFDYLAIYVAQDMGYFKDEGLKVKLVEQLGSDDCKMLAAGTAQFAYPSPGVMFSSIESGVTDIEAITNYDSVQIFGFAINKDSGIKSVQDLKGKKIATYSNAWDALGAPILQGAGLSNSDVTYVSYGDSRYQAVANGSTPALITWLAEYWQLVGQGYDLDYLDGNDYAAQVSNALCTSKTFAKAHPDIVKKFIRAFLKGLYFCYCNPDAAADITLRTCPNLDINWDGATGAVKGNLQQFFGVDENAEKKYIENGIGIFDMDMCQAAADHLKESGTIKNSYKASDYYTNEYVSEVTKDLDKKTVEADAKAYQCSSKQYKEK